MADDTTISAVLTELTSIANSAMTGDQREKRAEPVLSAAGVTLDEIIAASQRPDLSWNVNKARAFGVDVRTWLHSIEIICDPKPASVGQLLECIHQAESAAAMLKAGYQPGKNALGKLTWSRA